MISLTYNKALQIQAEQLQYYGMQLGYRGRKWLYTKIKTHPKPCDTHMLK